MLGAVALAAGLALTAGCDGADEDGEGTLRVTVYGEEFVEDRIPADEVVDGWEVAFDRFMVSVSDVAADGEPLGGTYVFDLRQGTDGAGHALGSMLAPAGTVEHLDYRVGPAALEAEGNVADEDVRSMAQAGLSLWVQGVATRDADVVRFDWGFTTDTRYTECETARPLADGGEATSQITIHADHLFYDDLDSETPNVAFDIIAEADVMGDGDGMVTPGELAALDITGQSRYQVGSRDITDLWSFIEAQTRTLGHIDGEAHCNFE